MSEGFQGGNLVCNNNTCQLDTSGCYQCGDGIVNGPEECDGGNLNGQTCQSLCFVGGSLSCSSCSFNTSQCTKCGNNQLDAGETCDGSNLNGQSCASQGFVTGTLLCVPSCDGYNTQQCTHGDCCLTGNPGSCSAPSILNCVCALDSWCCNTSWDSLCVTEAIDDCGAQC